MMMQETFPPDARYPSRPVMLAVGFLIGFSEAVVRAVGEMTPPGDDLGQHYWMQMIIAEHRRQSRDG